MRSLFRIAFRNTGRQKKRSVLLAGAIAFGVVVVTILNGFTGGVSRNIEGALTDMIGGHVYVSGTELTDSRLIINVIRDSDGSGSSLASAVDEVEDDIAELNRRSRTLGTLIFGSKQTNQFVEGVDWHGEPSFFPSLSLTAGSLPREEDRNALILPESVAGRLRVEIGDQVLVRVATVTGQQNVGELVLAATTEDAGFMPFSSAFVRLDYLGELIGTGAGQFQLLHLYLRDPRQSDRVAEVPRARLPIGPGGGGAPPPAGGPRGRGRRKGRGAPRRGGPRARWGPAPAGSPTTRSRGKGPASRSPLSTTSWRRCRTCSGCSTSSAWWSS
ncbi:MAG: ABC transporter permease [Spirochaetaceae bacterium]|nr:ABC transporter permease [Spirochaetaceae bacterium]